MPIVHNPEDFSKRELEIWSLRDILYLSEVALKIKKQQNHQNYGRFRCLLANTCLTKKGELRPKKVLGHGIRKITYY